MYPRLPYSIPLLVPEFLKTRDYSGRALSNAEKCADTNNMQQQYNEEAYDEAVR